MSSKKATSLEIESNKIWLVDGKALKVYPARLVEYSMLVQLDRQSAFSRFIGQELSDVLGVMPLRTSDDNVDLYLGFGRGDFYEKIVGSILYSPYIGVLSQKYWHIPYQSPIILPVIIGAKGIDEESAIPIMAYNDVAFIFLAVRIRNFSEWIAKKYGRFFEQIKSRDVIIDPKFFIKALVQDYGFPYMVKPSLDLDIDCRKYIDNIWRLTFVKKRSVVIKAAAASEFNAFFRIFNLISIDKFIRAFVNKYPNGFVYERIFNALNDKLSYVFFDGKSPKTRKMFSWSRLVPYVLAISTLELGIHAMAHALIKSVPFVFRSIGSRFGELLIIDVPQMDYLDDHYDQLDQFEKSLLSDMRSVLDKKIVDGFIYRKLNDTGEAYAMAIIFSKLDHSGESLELILNSSSEENVSRNNNASMYAEFMFKKLKGVILNSDNKDKCYNHWQDYVKPLRKRALLYIKNNLRGEMLEECGIEKSELLQMLIGLFDTWFKSSSKKTNNDPEKELFLPISSIRWFMFKIPKTIIDELSSNVDDKSTCKMRVREFLKLYGTIIYEAKVPNCFDGCYNCILWKNCYYPSPIMRAWVVSKYAMKSLIEPEGESI